MFKVCGDEQQAMTNSNAIARAIPDVVRVISVSCSRWFVSPPSLRNVLNQFRLCGSRNTGELRGTYADYSILISDNRARDSNLASQVCALVSPFSALRRNFLHSLTHTS